MITRKALGAIALATTCLTPLAAFADDFDVAPAAPAEAGAPGGPSPFRNEIQIDVGGVFGNNANQFGRYNGFNSGGPFGGIGELKLNNRAPWDSGDTWYYTLDGGNLFYQTSGHLGTGLATSGNWASDTHNGLANDGFLNFQFGQQGTVGLHRHLPRSAEGAPSRGQNDCRTQFG